ncbi:restriction endonuclease [Luteibacter flocculans]|uniref:Restriction endonuclease n=1 Tax=Luteibacter flocculans TaxID=2780091 RepID=A0ABY4T530_9GAMM|nr:restriction endonuclease [Luteibacter flocculans]URL60011.1 restriction endonuclease [Luteibacter flocculans]
MRFYLGRYLRLMFSARQTPSAGTDALARLSWHDFEHLLAEHYREQGWRVEYHTPPTSLKQLGGGFDLRLHRGSEVVIVQCKHWDAAEVQLVDVNELLSTMLNEAATRGVLVTRGRFSTEARAVARRQPRMQLVDADVLRVMLRLPDHLDTSVQGVALPASAVAKSRRVRRASDGDMSRLVPIMLVVVILALLGIFVWRAMNDRRAPVVPPPSSDAAPAASAPATVPVNVTAPPAATLPPPTATSTAAQSSDRVARELAERARLREAARAAAQDAHKQSEDAMKVMERNTREVGEAK